MEGIGALSLGMSIGYPMPSRARIASLRAIHAWLLNGETPAARSARVNIRRAIRSLGWLGLAMPEL